MNGEIRTPPLELADGSVKVYPSGDFIIVENECGVRLQFDGLQMAVLVVPHNFSGNLEGLCGDCDGEQNDYRLADGTDVSSESYATRNPKIGDSWRVPDDSDLPISQ